jgi:excisionase family DNA binding protein
MDLKSIQQYACVSERKVREWIHQHENPLPAAQVEKGKFLIKRSHFDRWLEAQAYRPNEAVDLGQIVDEVMKDLQQRPN